MLLSEDQQSNKGMMLSNQFDQKRTVCGCKFVKEWMLKYKHGHGGDGVD